MRAAAEPGLGRRALAVWRDGGPGALLFAALSRTVYRRLRLYLRELDDVPPDTPGGIETGFLGEDALPEYEALRPGHGDRARARFAAGHRCFALRVRGELASVRWVATGRPPVDYLGTTLDLDAGEAFSYDSFTGERFRRRGLSTLSQHHLAAALRAEGVRRLVRAVLPENGAGVRDALAAGYRPDGHIGWVRIGPWRRELRRP